jgi:MoaA/NifB/PqqE/SkfB family radical SAM enzyme
MRAVTDFERSDSSSAVDVVRAPLSTTPASRSHAPPLPRFVQIEPVGQCNLRCKMCAVQFREDGPPHGPLAFMAFDRYAAIVDSFPDLEELHLQGLGEPMMHPRFFEMVRYAAAKGVHVSCNSNLTLLSERRAEECVTSGLAALHVSLDAVDPALYEKIRVGSRYSRVCKNLERVLAARKRAGSTLAINIVMVLMRDNLRELPKLVDFAHRQGVDEIFVQHLCHDFAESALPAKYVPMRRFVESQTLSGGGAWTATAERCFAVARHKAERLGVKLRLPELRRASPRVLAPGEKRCDWPWRGAYISYDGLAMPCCMVGTPDRAHFGSVTLHGVRQVWKSAGYADFRQRLLSDDPPDVCASCAIYKGTF